MRDTLWEQFIEEQHNYLKTEKDEFDKLIESLKDMMLPEFSQIGKKV